MEEVICIRNKNSCRGFWLCILLLFTTCLQVSAQPKQKEYTIKDGKMYITLSKLLSPVELDEFVENFGLADLDLKTFIKTAKTDSLKSLGWEVVINNGKIFTISKALFPSEDLQGLDKKIIWSEDPLANIGARFPAVNNKVAAGANRFRNKNAFAFSNDRVTFFLRNQLRADEVKLAGSFTTWQNNAVSMTKTDSGWITSVDLKPGKYWYKFIVDGQWMADDDNLLRENDGEGNVNSVYFKPNVDITLDGNTGAKKVFLAGSFNKWNVRELPMNKTATGWHQLLYLAEGTHTYKFVVDGKWYTDEEGDKLPDGAGGYNSAIRIGKPHLFKLDGFNNARQVVLSGSFNDWKSNELYLIKTATGWQLPYTLGAGNYEYKFVVDGKWITDPANRFTTNNGNSYLIISPNYTFRLKGFSSAKNVYLAGEFNEWNPSAYLMQRQGDEWVFSVHLSPGKHLYKFVVDGKWMRDPDNKLWEQNEHDSGNSVLWINE